MYKFSMIQYMVELCLQVDIDIRMLEVLLFFMWKERRTPNIRLSRLTLLQVELESLQVDLDIRMLEAFLYFTSKEWNPYIRRLTLLQCCIRVVCMRPAKSFGITSPSDLFSKCVSQGWWTRCLRFQNIAGIVVKSLPDESHSVQEE